MPNNVQATKENHNRFILFFFSIVCRTIRRLPFNWKNPIGYLLAMIFETILDLVVIAVFVPFTAYFVGSCWLLSCIADDIPILNAKRRISHGKLKEDFCEMVQFYSGAKEFS